MTPSQKRVKTIVVGHRPVRYLGEPLHRREILKLAEPLTLRDHPATPNTKD